MKIKIENKNIIEFNIHNSNTMNPTCIKIWNDELYFIFLFYFLFSLSFNYFTFFYFWNSGVRVRSDQSHHHIRWCGHNIDHRM